MMDDPDLARRVQARVGSTLRNKYRLDAVLGVGGMAVVYAATHRNQAEFAIKMLHPELSYREDVKTRFLREGYAANSVKHPGVVQVVDDDVADDGAAFLVMELLRGISVEALWDKHKRRVPLWIALSIIDQLLDVLNAAHGKGIVHRDIKLANVFVTHDGTVKVLDFGIARARDAAINAAGTGTGTGMLLGTPAFMAPEQALAKTREVDAQTDVWAAAATLFTLITGQTVHLGENPQQLLILAATALARPISTVIVNISPMVAQVIDAGLAFDKRQRWPSAAAMREALREAYRSVYGALPGRVPLDQLFGELPPANVAAPAVPGYSHSPPPAPRFSNPGFASPAFSPPPALSPQAHFSPPPQFAPSVAGGTQSPAFGGAQPFTPAPAAQQPSPQPHFTPQPQHQFTPQPRFQPQASSPHFTPPPGMPGSAGGAQPMPMTPAPVAASVGGEQLPAASKSRWGMPVIAMVGGLVVAVGVVIAVVVVTTGGKPAPSEKVVASPPAATSAKPAPSPTEAPAASSPAPRETPSVQASAAPPPSAAPDESAQPRVEPAATKSASAPASAVAPHPTPTATWHPTATATASAKTPPPSCNPPFYFDADGTKHFKKECL